MADLTDLRAHFPVFERLSYLNAGTDGPVPREAGEAAGARTRLEVEGGRSGERYFEELLGLAAELRGRYGALLACEPGEVALTRSTTDGVNLVLAGLGLEHGDEVLTSDEEHPGLLAPLALATRRLALEVRTVPFTELAGAVTPRTRLVATSHVSWVGGLVVDAAGLRASGARVLLDGAQGLGAVPVDVRALGCDFYAASGQKWLCGPDATGCLYVRSDALEEISPPWPSYPTLHEPGRAAELPFHDDARRLDMGIVAGPSAAWALASLDLLGGAGWERVHERGATLAAGFAARLAERGIDVASRGRSTLVSWRSDDAEGDVRRLAAEGVVVRHLQGRGLVRASVGAWSSEEELDRLAALA